MSLAVSSKLHYHHESLKVIAVQNAEMTTTEKLARFETAQHIIGMMVAMRSRWISDEEKKLQPNRTQIAKWEQEQSKLDDQDNALLFDDSDGIEWVIASYGPVVKEQFSTQAERG